MRLVFCSDLHYAAEPGDEQTLQRAAATIDRLKPDMVVIAGDLTARGLVEQFAPVAEMARRLKTPHVFAIPGNRDYLAGGPPPSGPTDSDLDSFSLRPTPTTSCRRAHSRPSLTSSSMVWTSFTVDQR